MQAGDLVRHKKVESVGLGLVMSLRDPHACLVQWTGGVMSWRPSLESIKMLEVVNAGR